MIEICSKCQQPLEKPRVHNIKNAVCRKCQLKDGRDRYYKNKLARSVASSIIKSLEIN